MSGQDEPQLHVTHPVSPHDLAGLGHAEHPVSVPVPVPVSYSILIRPPEGELIAFSDNEGHPPERYEQARFFLGSENRGTFTFMPSGTEIRIEGSGTVDATEERVSFTSPVRDLSGTFLFPRDGPRGEVTLRDGSVHLKARAVRGIWAPLTALGTPLGTPLPDDDGWAYVIVLPDGRWAKAEAEFRGKPRWRHPSSWASIRPGWWVGRVPSEHGRTQRERNTSQLQAGVTCDELGETNIPVIPGAEIDADKDGFGCED